MADEPSRSTAGQLDADPGVTHAPLRDSVVADTAVRAFVEELNEASLGLVLSGGGGKGAYEAGVLLALYDCGVKSFAAIAGTSVGGLNAALAHEMWRPNNPHGRKFVVDLWANIGPRSVLGMSGGLVLKPMLYALAAGWQSAGTVLKLVQRNLEIDAELHDGKDLLVTTSIATLGAVAAMTVSGLVTMLVYLPLQRYFGAEDAPLAFVVTLLLAMVFAAMSGGLGRKLALFSNAPLAATIAKLPEEIIADGKPPVMCTLAAALESPVVDLKGSMAYRPDYFELTTSNDVTPRARDVLLQTAAIPEVFPSRVFFGTRFVDGGVADNIPILGLADKAPDRIIVIYLDHRFRRVEDLARWQMDRLLKVTQSRSHETGDASRIAWARQALSTAVSFIPSQNVGNLLTGTLNFTPHKARRLMHMGYKDALDTVKSLAVVATHYSS